MHAPNNPPSRLRLLSLLLVMTLAVAACGDDDPKSGGDNNAPFNNSVNNNTVNNNTSNNNTANNNTVNNNTANNNTANNNTANNNTANNNTANNNTANNNTNGNNNTNNTNNGDEGTPRTHTLPETEVCGAVTMPPAGSICAASGSGTNVVLQGTVLGIDKVYEGGQVVYTPNGRIACVGCGCATAPEAADAVTINCGDAVISPGLINAHDHITFTQNDPARWGDERYEHRHDWRKGIRGHTRIPAGGGASGDEMLWGELRQAMTGTTSLSGSGGTGGLLRNLDQASNIEGLGQPAVELDTFPLNDTDGDLLSSGCGYPSLPSASVLSEDAYSPHVSEGIDEEARNEFRCLVSTASGGRDIVSNNSAFIHGVALLPPDAAEMAREGGAVIWSPRSNVSLYGNTASVTMLHAQGVLLGLGTDWTPSGSVNMTRELACVDYLNENNYFNYFSDHEMWLMATYNNAVAFAMDDAIGSLADGLIADIAIYARGGAANPWRAVIDATPDTTALVLRAGAPIYGEPPVVSAVGVGDMSCDTIAGGVCGTNRSFCAQRSSGEVQFSSLAAANTGSYELFFCDVPVNEPSCVPFRNTEYDGVASNLDLDGDGLSNDADNCPHYFNPVRPLDNGVQADFDNDGLGDACDPCPLDANTTSCSVPSAYDPDGDGILGPDDNCPGASNVDQIDTDSDGKGDACDACPNESNPGSLGCPTTIYAIKQGMVTEGSVVVEGVVTAVADPRFFIQVATADQDATLGANYSAVYVYVPTGNPGALTLPAPGDRVRVSASVNEFFGQIQLDTLTSIEVVSSGNALPAPLELTSTELDSLAETPAPWEGALVKTSGMVSALNPDNLPSSGTDTAMRFLLDDKAWVDTFIVGLDPFPSLGDEVEVTGVLRYANNRYKLSPRTLADVRFLNAAEAELAALTEETVYIESTEVNADGRPALTLTLTRPVVGESVTVMLESSAPGVVTVPATLVIPNNTSSAIIPLTGVTAGNATITATLNGNALTAEVVVLAADRQPVVAMISPDPVTVSVGGSAMVTVTLDQPAPAAGTVVTLATQDGNAEPAAAELTIPAWETTGTFALTGVTLGADTLTASTGGDDLSVAVSIVDRPMLGLILSEALINPAGTDDAREWVEIYNGTSAPVNLAGYSLGGGGTDYTYTTIQLAGTIPAGGCFVVGGTVSEAANFNPTLDQSITFSPGLQNGSGAADGLALFNVPAAMITENTVPIDAVIYGGMTNSSNLLDESGMVGGVDNASAGNGATLERTPEGWVIQAVPSPNNCTPLF